MYKRQGPNELHLVDTGCLKDLDERGVLCAIMTDGPARNPWMILAPVSYTHLDVYKRQALFNVGPTAFRRVNFPTMKRPKGRFFYKERTSQRKGKTLWSSFLHKRFNAMIAHSFSFWMKNRIRLKLKRESG